MVSARVRREQVAYVQSRGRSHRRACALLAVARSTAHDVSRLQQRDAPAVQAMRDLAGQYPRTAFIDPGKPWQNGTDESFNGKFRNECLTMEWFRNRLEAKVGIERWRRHYNEERPHMSLGDQTPAEFKAQIKNKNSWLKERAQGATLQ